MKARPIAETECFDGRLAIVERADSFSLQLDPAASFSPNLISLISTLFNRRLTYFDYACVYATIVPFVPNSFSSVSE